MPKRKKSFFNKLLHDFILLLCIPLITILLIFTHSDNTLKEQVLESASKNFNLYYEQMEKTMKDMRDTCMAIYSNDYCKLYSFETVNGTSLDEELKKRVYNYLHTLIKDKQMYYDVFLYYYRNDRIISGNKTSMTAERYYEAYYGDIDQEDYRVEFLNIIKQDNKMPICRVIKDYTGQSYICMSMGFRSNIDESLNYTICVVLSPEYLNQMLVMKDINEDSVFLIYNNEIQNIMSNNEAFKTLEIEKYLMNGEMNCNIWLDVDNYMLQIRESDILKNQYIYIVTSKQFWIVVRQIRIYCVLGIIVCIIVSISFAYRSAKMAYKPLKNVVDYIGETENSLHLEKDNEFAYIISHIKDKDYMLKESEKNNQELNLRKILEGKFVNNSLFPHKCFVVCILHIESFSEEINDLYQFIIKNVFEELGDTIGKSYIVDLSERNCVFIVNMRESNTDLEKIINEGQKFLNQYYQIVLTIGCSNVYQNTVEIPKAYKEAQEAVKYRFLMGFGGRIFYEEVRYRSLMLRKNGESKIYMMILNFMKQDYMNKSVISFVDDLVYIYEINEMVSMELANFFKIEIIEAISKIMEVQGNDEELRLNIINQLHDAETLIIFKEILCENITKLCEEKSDKSTSEDICMKVKNYIEENYDDNQISVAMIGKQMGMQAAHLSKLFKEAYGISILDYIASVRISEAKRMIREEKMSVQDVAEKVGFINSHAFIRIFKKLENITPGKYKDLCDQSK